MEENTGNQAQPVSANQPLQGVQAPPTPNIFQSSQPDVQQSETIQPSGGDKPKSGKKSALILAFVFLIVILVVISFFVMQKYSKSNDQATVEQQAFTSSPTINQQQTDSGATLSEITCDNFPNMLDSCTKYTCQFTHPVTGEQMTREIVGINDDKCSYSERMPNGGKMDCEYTEEMRVAVAEYHRDLADSESFGTEISAELSPEGSEVKTTYTINGKVVDNPLQEALNTGQCVVSGY